MNWNDREKVKTLRYWKKLNMKDKNAYPAISLNWMSGSLEDCEKAKIKLEKDNYQVEYEK